MNEPRSAEAIKTTFTEEDIMLARSLSRDERWSLRWINIVRITVAPLDTLVTKGLVVDSTGSGWVLSERGYRIANLLRTVDDILGSL